VAIAASSALLLDYLRGTPTFCGLGSGCDKIRRSGLGTVAGLPVPLLGLLAFAGLYLLSLVPSPDARRLTKIAAVVGGVIAAGLIVVQAVVVGAFCVFCVTVDTSAIVAAVAAFIASRGELTPSRLGLPGWLALGSEAKPPPPVPKNVMSLWKPGVVNIVEFSDFECPFCRMAHPKLEDAKGMAKVPIHFVRKSMPLPSHPNARPASRAYHCAEAQGRGDPMADALFEGDLSMASIEASAQTIGVDVERLRVCMADPATDAAIDRDVAFVRGSDFQGLPTVWIGDKRILGAGSSVADYVEAIRSANKGSTGVAGQYWPLAALFVFTVGGVALSIRRREDDAAPVV
jgi:uncharacterized membrane protein/predicted DsbA family dithiol-disulfide isomerase